MVLVSHRHGFIYLKTKKTASTSVEAVFEPFCADDPDHRPEHFTDEIVGEAGIIGCRRGRAIRAQRTWHAHMTAAQVLRHLGPRRWLGYFKFTTIRNPFSKCVSQFLYLNRDDTALISAPIEDRREAFGRWFDALRVKTDRTVYAIAGRPIVQDYIRFERLEDDIARLGERLGLELDPARLPEFKKSANTPREPYAAYYTDRSRAAVARAYAPEIRRFGYRFEEDGGAHGAG